MAARARTGPTGEGTGLGGSRDLLGGLGGFGGGGGSEDGSVVTGGEPGFALVPEAEQEPGKDGSGDGGGGDSGEDAVEDGSAEVGVVGGGGEHGGGMGRQGPMNDGEAGQDGQAHEDGRAVAALGSGCDDGHEQDQADFEENRHADEDADGHQGPGEAAGSAAVEEESAEGGGATGGGEQTAEDCTHAEDDGDVAHHVADAGGEGKRDPHEGHAGGDAEGEAGDGEGEGGVEANFGDEDQEEEDGSTCTGQEEIVVGCSGGWRHGGIIP